MAHEKVLYVRVPADLNRVLKVAAATEGQTMTEVVERAVRKYLTPGG